jgi:predicted secreted protein
MKTHYVIDAETGNFVESAPTLSQAQTAAKEINARWGEGAVFVIPADIYIGDDAID